MKPGTIRIIGVIAGILLAVGVFWFVTSVPEAQNTVRTILPEQNAAQAPPEQISAPKERDEAGSMQTYSFDKTYSTGEINRLIKGLYGAYDHLPAQHEVDHYTVTFNTTDEKGVLLTVKGQIYVPKTSGEQSYPVYVFGAGTTGLDDKCAPSKEISSIDNWGDYNAHMLSYAAQGYIVFFPDYEGFNDLARMHHYFNSELEAKVMLDAARATFDFFTEVDSPVTPEEAVFMAGYSQGGHAAFAAKDFHEQYAPEVPLKGVIGYASANDVIALLQENPSLAPYLVVAYQDFYGKEAVDFTKILSTRWLDTLQIDAVSKCISEASKYFDNTPENMYTSDFQEALYNDFEGTHEFEEFERVLRLNNTGYNQSSVPMLMLQGSADPITSQESAEEFIDKACQNKNKLRYMLYDNVHHYQTRQVSYMDTLEWMESVRTGEEVQNECT